MRSSTSLYKRRTWKASAPHVRKALKFIRAKGVVTPNELVEWDRTHGARLFPWDDAAAATAHRLYMARLFLNHFRGTFDGMRVRAFIKVRPDEDVGIHADGYVSVETIAQHVGMRAQVIADIRKRMASLASELRMWRLTPVEQADLFAQLRAAMNGEPDALAQFWLNVQTAWDLWRKRNDDHGTK